MNETRQRTMPDQLRPVFEDLRGQVMFLHMKWKVYRDFYEPQESLDVINELVPGVFNVLEHTLRTDIIITLCRLTDPVSTGGKQNLTIDRLLTDVEPLAPDWLNERLQQMHTELKTQVKPVRELRNRVVGHNDYQTALSTHPDPLPQLTRAHFLRSVDLLADLLNEVDLHFTEDETDFAHPVERGSGADLIHHLRRASRAYDVEDALFRGEIRRTASDRNSAE